MFKFQLRSGRAIKMVRLAVEETYSGVLEGSRETASGYIRKELHDRAAGMLPPARPLAIVDDYAAELPRWLCVGLFNSYSGARTEDIDAGSRLYACWFMEDTAENLEDEILRALDQIIWEKQAEDYDMMDF